MIFFLARGRRERQHVPVQTTPPPVPRAPDGLSEVLAAIEADIDRAMGRHARPGPADHPYAPEPVDPLTAPEIEITETAVLGHLLADPPPSPVREAVWRTHRASNFRFPVRCLCGREHHNLNADTFADLYASARNAKWREDRFRTWRCPRCVRRLEALRRAPRVAAIEGGAA
jgi:hypothetical protein